MCMSDIFQTETVHCNDLSYNVGDIYGYTTSYYNECNVSVLIVTSLSSKWCTEMYSRKVMHLHISVPNLLENVFYTEKHLHWKSCISIELLTINRPCSSNQVQMTIKFLKLHITTTGSGVHCRAISGIVLNAALNHIQCHLLNNCSNLHWIQLPLTLISLIYQAIPLTRASGVQSLPALNIRKDHWSNTVCMAAGGLWKRLTANRIHLYM